MATETVLDLIKLSLKKARVLGLGDILSDEEAQDALDIYNLMLESWSLDNLFIYVEELQSFNVTGRTYTIGPGGDFDAARPFSLVSAYAQVGEVSYPIEILDNAQQYDAIMLKSLGSAWPCAVWYEQTYPLGRLHFWPLGSAQVNLRFTTPLQQFPSLTTPISLPPGYKKVIVDAGAVELAQAHNTEISALVVQSAANSIARLKRFNRKPRTMRIEVAGSRYGWGGAGGVADGGDFLVDGGGDFLVPA